MQAVSQHICYSTVEDFACSIDEAEIKAREIFETARKDRVIFNNSFDDVVWEIDNQVKTLSLTFDLSDLQLNNIKEYLDVSKEQYVLAIKIGVTFYLFYRVAISIPKMVRDCQKLIYLIPSLLNGETEQLSKLNCTFTAEVLTLLQPTPVIEELIDILNEYEAEFSYSSRSLAQFQSYFHFQECISNFWANAEDDEKLLYFPIWLWWELTSILPLRPREFLLTQYNCLRQDDNKNYYLTIRRTMMKGANGKKVTHKIEFDYKPQEYRISHHIGSEVDWYQTQTVKKARPLLFLPPKGARRNMLRYESMNSLMKKFIDEVIVRKYGYELLEKESKEILIHRKLGEKQIERINLGDSRHLAMINLIRSGGSPVICAELASHSDIEISSHYYTSLESCVESVAYEIFSKHSVNRNNYEEQYGLILSEARTEINGGYCLSTKVAKGDYTDCSMAFGMNNELGSHQRCHYFLPNGTQNSIDLLGKNEQEAKADMNRDYEYLRHAIDMVRKSMGCTDEMQSALLRLNASAQRVCGIVLEKLCKGGA